MSNFINVKNFKKWIQEKDLERKALIAEIFQISFQKELNTMKLKV